MTTGQLIHAARLAKACRRHDELPPDTAARITPRQMYRQADLANDAGIAQTMISAYECGNVEPELATLRKIAAALEVPISELIG